MGRFVIRRLLLTIPVLLGASFLIFAMVYALPGDPIRALAGDRPLAPAVAAQLRADYNLNDPLVVQYGKYLGGLAQGDLGSDFRGRPVLDTISQRLPVTARLTLVAVLFEPIIGLAAGLLAGIRRNGFFDNLVLVSTTIIISIPILVLGFFAQFIFGLKLGWFPIAGINEGWYSYLLPGLVLASASLAYVARLTRTSIAENMSADYVRTARAKGLPNRTVIVAAHAAQQPDPGGHVHRCRHRCPARRRDRDRGRLQHPGHRPGGVRRGPGPGRCRRRRHRHAHGVLLRLLQPDRRRALRRPRPEDPL